MVTFADMFQYTLVLLAVATLTIALKKKITACPENVRLFLL